MLIICCSFASILKFNHISYIVIYNGNNGFKYVHCWGKLWVHQRRQVPAGIPFALSLGSSRRGRPSDQLTLTLLGVTFHQVLQGKCRQDEARWIKISDMNVHIYIYTFGLPVRYHSGKNVVRCYRMFLADSPCKQLKRGDRSNFVFRSRITDIIDTYYSPCDQSRNCNIGCVIGLCCVIPRISYQKWLDCFDWADIISHVFLMTMGSI